MNKRKQDPIIGERLPFTLISATEFSPMVDKSCPISSQGYYSRNYSDHYCVSLNNTEIQRLPPKDLHKQWRHTVGIKHLCRISKILIEWFTGPWTRLNVWFYNVMILYWCIFKKIRSNSTQLTACAVVWYVCAYDVCACVWHVCTCVCAFRLSPHLQGMSAGYISCFLR